MKLRECHLRLIWNISNEIELSKVILLNGYSILRDLDIRFWCAKVPVGNLPKKFLNNFKSFFGFSSKKSPMESERVKNPPLNIDN